ncbi:MAG: hypothetical protein ACPGSD_05050 [Flavobacteriales bacterium]
MMMIKCKIYIFLAIVMGNSFAMIACECEFFSTRISHENYYYYENIFMANIESIKTINDSVSLIKVESIENFKGKCVDSFYVEPGTSCSLNINIGDNWLLFLNDDFLFYCNPSRKKQDIKDDKIFDFLRFPQTFKDSLISNSLLFTKQVNTSELWKEVKNIKCYDYSKENKVVVLFSAICQIDGRIHSIEKRSQFKDIDVSSLSCVINELQKLRAEPAEINGNPVNSIFFFPLRLTL